MIFVDPLEPRIIEQAGPINRSNFIEFCHETTIASKDSDEETGSLLVRLDLSPTQIYGLDAVLYGLDTGIHTFLFLKGRQVRITTFCLALVVYWLQKYSGVKAVFVIDKDDRRQEHREIVEDMVNSLPSPKWRHPCVKFNNQLCKFSNRSQLSFLCANSRTKGALGSSIGSLVIHGSEMGLWGDEEGFNSLMASRSLTAPQRLILLEGRAFGLGLWHDMWETACESTDQLAVFVGWWRHPQYSYPQNSIQYRTYWETYPELSPEEVVWVDAIASQYHFKITSQQMAWWRCELRESMRGNLENMYENFPPTPEQAFRMGGKNFFSQDRLLELSNTVTAEKKLVKPRYFSFRWGSTFEQTEIVEVEPYRGGYDLTIWEPPPERHESGMLHCMGIDPAYGVSATSDGSCIEVFRCYSDGLDQVAEFYSRGRGCDPHRLTWVLIYLASAYLTSSECYYNLELQGGGHQIEGELERMRLGISVGVSNKIGKKFSSMRPYLYSRPDAVRPAYSSKHFKTSHELRELMLCDLQNYIETGLMKVRGVELLRECALFQRTVEGDIISVGTGSHSEFNDDRVMAAALALQVYLKPILYFIGNTKFTRVRDQEEKKTIAGKIDVGDLIAARVQQWYVAQGGKPSGSRTQR